MDLHNDCESGACVACHEMEREAARAAMPERTMRVELAPYSATFGQVMTLSNDHGEEVGTVIVRSPLHGEVKTGCDQIVSADRRLAERLAVLVRVASA